VTGKSISEFGFRIADLRRRDSHFNPQPAVRNPQANGFTLLELMIVISIIIILAAVALPQYQKTVVHARETTLRHDLSEMRKMIDQYAADKGKLPTQLEDLVSGRYLREIPEDPMTREKDWQPTSGEDPNSTEGGTGIIDVHSNSPDTGSDGTAYNTW
jgi:general secretion pathway protein G